MMHSPLLLVFLFLFSLFNESISIQGAKKNISTNFTPTHEWKKVEDMQVLPPGLHIRINLHTGEKEAKLPDQEENNEKKSLILTKESTDESNSDEVSKIDREELKKILKKIKTDDLTNAEKVKKSFRSYEELKKDFSSLNLQFKSDLELVAELIQSFKNFNLKIKDGESKGLDYTDDEEILTVLVDLEYLVHQYENAQEFAKLNGFSDVVYVSLNSTNAEIRSEALRLLGSATQSNPIAQVKALVSGSLNLVLKILTFDEDINVRSRSLFALSCLIRKFPLAQQKFVANGGLTAFAKVFDEEKQDFVKLHVKIITLIHDLLFERKDIKMNISEEESKNQTDSKIETFKERLKQYEKIELEKKLVEQEWCNRITNWFLKQNYIKNLNKNLNAELTLENVNLDSHDTIEKVVDTLYVLSDICKIQFKNNKEFIELLFTLKDIYSVLALTEAEKNDEGANQFYTSLSKVLKILTEKLRMTVKDEL